MLDNGRKTIGVVAFQIVDSYQKLLCTGVQKRCKELGYNMVVFSSFGKLMDNKEFDIGESIIARIPDYERLDGLIIATDTITIANVIDEVMRSVKERVKCPVVSLRRELDTDYKITIDNENCMDGVIRHFLDDHGFKDVCFLAGPEGVKESEERLQNYFRLMKERNLPVTDDMWMYGDFWKDAKGPACDQFIDKRGKVPEAIICANDYMGISVCHELNKRGYRVPEDVAVCGYDGIEETDLSAPTLTTMTVDFEEMGKQAVDCIIGKMKEKTVLFSSKLCLKSSCGCVQKEGLENLKLRKDFFAEYEQENLDSIVATFQSNEFEAADTLEEISATVQKYLYMLHGCKCLYIAIQKKILSTRNMSYANTNIENTMTLFGAYYEDREKSVFGGDFDRKYLIPPTLTSDEPVMLYVVPFHFRENNLGYIVYEVEADCIGGYPMIFQNFVTNLVNTIQGQFNREQMNLLIDSLEELSIHDSMTGVYNRYGFEEDGKEFFEHEKMRGKKVFFLSVDLDYLKEINDTYGHSEGDFAIQEIAKGLKNSFYGDVVIARMGGDEYDVVGSCESEKEVKEKIETFYQYLKDTKHKYQYELHASVGHYVLEPDNDMSWEECLMISDNRMYAKKRAYKKEREA